ncbi:uncharacterized protein LACBIDRAFT_314453 [Laccaria bicolor S238N-H82]|uniref:Predicted protein n=1 Tax=Laccaria bicolor (strain S238N-H82 / ATCC MYA-4686) TaxID=486041 RepID=B0DYL2_LACBS|nr:uncharacterized protein LACBIDRAFT_314453 [Laccaria bicolor S238N-H82]EDR00314.1 predicted protein [Laccaria bicolor S238N-H82]|eukprot:XP_001889066.1 predicted protein [Laccaria bicolor S238N-H82]
MKYLLKAHRFNYEKVLWSLPTFYEKNIALIRKKDTGHTYESHLWYVKIIAGDQLTIARQRSILNVRVGHESGADAWKHIVLMPGLFHAKIADCHGLLQVHFGKSSTRSPGSLAFHNTCLNQIPIVLTSLPSFHVCRDLSMVSLYACILHCLLLVSGTSTLEEYISKKLTWEAMCIHAHKILETYANADRVQELQEPRIVKERKPDAEKKAEKKSDILPKSEATAQSKKPQEVPLPHIPKGDMVFENASLFMCDALLTRLFSDTIKSGDSGLIILVLKLWSFAYWGSGWLKYAHKMLHLLHNLVNVWTSQLRKIIVQNWLLNPTGKANTFVEIDLVQEHLNFWIKKVYKADSDGHSWDWLSLVSLCIDVLRRVAKKIHSELGSQLGSKHTIPDLHKDIQTLMDALNEHEVYVVKDGRVLDANDTPVPNVISTGLVALAHGNATNPLAEFNAQYDSLCERRKLVPISNLCLISANTHHPESSTAVPIPVITEQIPANETGSEDEYEGLPQLAITSDSEDEEDREDPYDKDLFADSPTLTRLEEEDVALEMDDLVLDDPGMDWDSNEQGDSDEDLD